MDGKSLRADLDFMSENAMASEVAERAESLLSPEVKDKISRQVGLSARKAFFNELNRTNISSAEQANSIAEDIIKNLQAVNDSQLTPTKEQ